jgi:hypothetical protein
MRLYHLTSHHEALRIIAEGFYGSESPEPVCYLLLDSLDVKSPLDPAVAVLEVEGDIPLQELGLGKSPASRSAYCRLFVATARDLARARVRLVDVRSFGDCNDRRA